MPPQSEVAVLLALRGAPEEDLVRRIATEPGLTVVRRCADLAELTAAAVAGLGTVAVVDADLGVDRTFLERLRAHGVRPVVCCQEGDVVRHDGLGALALAHGVDPLPAIRSLAEAAASGTEQLADVERLNQVLGAAPSRGAGETDDRSGDDVPPAAEEPRAAHHTPSTSSDQGAAVGPTPGPELPATRRERRRQRSGANHPVASAAPEDRPDAAPRVVAVTGPGGSPGRTTIAINLAHELAQHGDEVVLIDADLWGGAIAQTLGLLAETAGLSAAVRAADHGRLDEATFARLAPKVADRLRVLPGLARATRWREVSAVSMLALLDTARRVATWVVVELPVLVPEEEAGYSLGPGRNDVARSLLGAAEEILVVGAAEPIGIERLVQTLLDLDDVPTTGRRRVLVNRLRTSAAGPRAADSVREALARFADVPDPALVPDDRALSDRALLAGTTWREAGGRSAARVAVTELAGELRRAAGRPTPVADRRLARLWPRSWRRATAH